MTTEYVTVHAFIPEREKKETYEEKRLKKLTLKPHPQNV